MYCTPLETKGCWNGRNGGIKRVGSRELRQASSVNAETIGGGLHAPYFLSGTVHQWPSACRYRSASMAALHPDAAATMA